jgi:outer membrane usher protein
MVSWGLSNQHVSDGSITVMNKFSKYLRFLLLSGSFYPIAFVANAENLDPQLSKQPVNQSPQTVGDQIPASDLSQSAAQTVILDLAVNLVEKGQLTAIIKGEDIFLKPKDLESVGISTKGIGRQETIEGENYLSLSSLAPNITYTFDINLLKLALTSSADRLTEVNVRDLYNRNVLPPGTIFSKDSSAYLNYALNYNRVQDIDQFTVFSELGYSFDTNVVSTTITRDPKGQIVRGISSITIDNNKSLDRWTIGDNFANLGEIGGNLTVGGVSISRQFSLNPYYVSSPQDATLKGSVTTPSTVDVYNNGILIRREQLNPGQFELRNLDRDNGLNNTTLIIRDAFGREQIVKTPFYFTSALLQPGVSDYFLNVGLKRPSLNSSNYESPGVRGNYRWGVSNSLTAGVRMEAATNLLSVGSDVALKLSSFGELGAGVAASSGESSGGWAGYLRYNYTERNYTLGASVKLFSDNYAHSSLAPTNDRNLFDASIQASARLSESISISARYSKINSRDLGNGDLLGLDGSINLSPDTNLTLSAVRSLQPGNKNGDSIFASLNINLGDSTRGNIGYKQQAGSPSEIVTQVEKTLGIAEDFGYRVAATSRDAGLAVNTNLRYQNSVGLYEFNYSRDRNIDNTGVNIAGGAILIGGKTVFSRPLFNSSYSLVQVPGVAGVRVNLNSTEVGRTNASGDLIVTNLQPYYANSIGINLDDVPVDYRIEPTSKLIAPPAKAGAIVTFPPQRIQNIVGKVLIKNKDKTIVPAYGNLIITVGNKAFNSPLSEQGEFYLENIPAGKHPAKIEYEEKECKFDFQIPKVDRPSIELPLMGCQLNF